MNEATDIPSTQEYLNENYPKKLSSISYSNIPNLITFKVWTKSAQETKIIQDNLQKEGFKDVAPHIILE
ncbi:MAG: hypothetical protein R6W84_09345 [Promethearchaeia archaeon]|nr:MAG: hypothetical protein EU541_07160 [Candidatus Lokiarchaeota archaeon]